MGAWGVKIYQDDVACDVRDEYKEALKKGISNEEISEKLIEEYTGYEDDEEEAIFWFALADTQWKLGRLLEEVKENAIKYIDSKKDLERWEEDPKLREKRKKVLLELKEQLVKSISIEEKDKLKEQLERPQPEEKKIRKYEKPYKCEWKIGDVFAYPIKSKEAKEIGLEGQYFIIIKTGETSWYPEHIIPVVKIKVTKNGKIPKTVEEINELEYIQSRFYTYYHGLPVTLDQFKFPKDEYGLISYYDMGIITTSKRVIPKELQYIGNFANKIEPPKIEFRDSKKSSYELSSGKCVLWKELEKIGLIAYKRYNLKQDEIYQPDYWEKQGIDREAKDKKIEEYFKKKGLL